VILLRPIPRPSLRTLRPLLVAYGIGFAIYASVHLAGAIPNDAVLMGTREDGIRASIAVLDHGGPPLLGAKTTYGAPGVNPARDYYPVGVTDDQGLYLYLPVLGSLTGEQDPHILLKWFFIGCFALLFAVYPLIFFELTGSVLAGIAAPILALVWFPFLRNSDLYWIVGWCVLLCLPLVFVVLKRTWSRWSIALLLLTMVLASFATSIRIHTGLPILLAALAVVFLKERSWPRRAAISIALVVASFSFSVGVLDAARIARDETVGVDFRKSYPSQHPFWHNAYIGLGYVPNKYGISWNDQVAIDAVAKKNPHAGYLTPAYENTLRGIYFNLFRHDPLFVLGTLWTKFGVCLDDALNTFGAQLLFLPLLLLFGRRRHDMRRFLALSIPAFVLTLLAPVITLPDADYEAGWLSSVGLVSILIAAWLLATAPDVLTWRRTALAHRSDLSPHAIGSSIAAVLPSRRELLVVFGSLALCAAIAVPAIAHARSKRAQAHATSVSVPAAARPIPVGNP
jgi:hypothetical protein